MKNKILLLDIQLVTFYCFSLFAFFITVFKVTLPLTIFYLFFRFRHLNHKYIKPIFVKDGGSATKADKVLNVYHSITERHALSRAETMPEINIGQKIPLLNAE